MFATSNAFTPVLTDPGNFRVYPQMSDSDESVCQSQTQTSLLCQSVNYAAKKFWKKLAAAKTYFFREKKLNKKWKETFLSFLQSEWVKKGTDWVLTEYFRLWLLIVVQAIFSVSGSNLMKCQRHTGVTIKARTKKKLFYSLRNIYKSDQNCRFLKSIAFSTLNFGKSQIF